MIQPAGRKALYFFSRRGSEGGPVTLPVFKTGDWCLAVSMVRSTRTRFRQVSSIELIDEQIAPYRV